MAATNLPDDGHPPVAPAPIAPAPVATPVQSYVSPYHIPYAPHYQNYVPAAIPNVEIVETPIIKQEPVEMAKSFYQLLDKESFSINLFNTLYCHYSTCLITITSMMKKFK